MKYEQSSLGHLDFLTEMSVIAMRKRVTLEQTQASSTIESLNAELLDPGYSYKNEDDAVRLAQLTRTTGTCKCKLSLLKKDYPTRAVNFDIRTAKLLAHSHSSFTSETCVSLDAAHQRHLGSSNKRIVFLDIDHTILLRNPKLTKIAVAALQKLHVAYPGDIQYVISSMHRGNGLDSVKEVLSRIGANFVVDNIFPGELWQIFGDTTRLGMWGECRDYFIGCWLAITGHSRPFLVLDDHLSGKDLRPKWNVHGDTDYYPGWTVLGDAELYPWKETHTVICSARQGLCDEDVPRMIEILL